MQENVRPGEGKYEGLGYSCCSDEHYEEAKSAKQRRSFRSLTPGDWRFIHEEETSAMMTEEEASNYIINYLYTSVLCLS